MTTGTFTSCDRETVLAWRSPVGHSYDGPVPLVRYWSPEASVLFVLDRRTGCPWLAISPVRDATMSLAPAPYLGALSTVLSDLLTEEGP